MSVVLNALIGLVFGLGLVISGMTDPAKIVNFLDLAGTWDPSLAFVMLGAVAVTFLGYRLAWRRSAPLLAGGFQLPKRTDLDGRLLVGSGLFGIGWGLSGFCPGPAVTSLSLLTPGTLVFVPAMLSGLSLARLTQRPVSIATVTAAGESVAAPAILSKRSTEDAMIFRQLFDTTSSTYSYLIASRQGAEALIVDPVLEKVDRYIQLLNELDLRLVKAVDTHLHADHITGLGALRDRTRCITVMGEQTKADIVSMRVRDGDRLEIEGIGLDAIYTPGHTDDSYSYVMGDRVFTGDTLLIRGTGRTDFQNGDARAQYDSIFGRLLRLPESTLVFPAHDYKGDTVSTIGEERRFNPRLQVKSVEQYIELMNNLKLPNPKMMDVAVPANMKVGLAQDEIARRGWALKADKAVGLVGRTDLVLVDLREPRERKRYGEIEGSIHAPYADLQDNLEPSGLLRQLASGKRLVFYCAFGERSAMAVQAAQDAGITSACHIEGGLDAWRRAGGRVVA